MPYSSLVGKSVILISAVVGGVVGTFELIDRFVSPSAETTVAVPNDQAPDTSVEGAVLALETPSQVEEPAPSNETGAPDLAAQDAERSGTRTPLEAEMWGRVDAHLKRLNCDAVAISEIKAEALIVPEDETTHGFEGHTLEGAVTLTVATIPERIRVIGSGKGPTGEIAALDMAVRSFEDQVAQNVILQEHCKGM